MLNYNWESERNWQRFVKGDYEVIGQNMMMLVASGTPVILKEKRSNSDLH